MSDEICTIEPQVIGLLSDPDNIERLRDHIARVLKCELANQYAIAIHEEISNADMYNFRVYVESTCPYEEDRLLEGPIVNITLQEVSAVNGNAHAGQQKQKAIFCIDCAVCGNGGGEEWSDKAANIRAWAAARVIRRILMSEQYTYLRLRGIVGSRNIVSIQTGAKENEGTPAAVAVARITLEVIYLECAIEASWPSIESIHFAVNPASGEVTMAD